MALAPKGYLMTGEDHTPTTHPFPPTYLLKTPELTESYKMKDKDILSNAVYNIDEYDALFYEIHRQDF